MHLFGSSKRADYPLMQAGGGLSALMNAPQRPNLGWAQKLGGSPSSTGTVDHTEICSYCSAQQMWICPIYRNTVDHDHTEIFWTSIYHTVEAYIELCCGLTNVKLSKRAWPACGQDCARLRLQKYRNTVFSAEEIQLSASARKARSLIHSGMAGWPSKDQDFAR